MIIKKFTIEQLERYEKVVKLGLRGIFVFLLFWYSVYFQYIPIAIMRLDPTQIDESMQVILSCFSSFVTMFLLFIIYRKDLKKEFQI